MAAEHSTCIYALACERTAAHALALLDALVPRRAPTRDEYPMPQYADQPREVLVGDSVILERLEHEPSAPYSLYRDSQSPGEPYMGMLFFTEDGGMIVGVDADETVDSFERWIRELGRLTGARWAFVCGDQPPPFTSQDFEAICRRADGPKIVDGVFVSYTPW